MNPPQVLMLRDLGLIEWGLLVCLCELLCCSLNSGIVSKMKPFGVHVVWTKAVLNNENILLRRERGGINWKIGTDV